MPPPPYRSFRAMRGRGKTMQASAVISSLLAVFRSPLGPHACDLNIYASLNTPDDPRGSSGGREEGKEAEGKALRGRRETKRRRKQGMKGASWLAGWRD
ncbi:hypothetical protein E2C01_007483 [Portunus trituberculatus]|uniref:Uncharacterized protein n=1 Tax=Portunus trituberculatus TaxID=210409 RepID=A0A5B7CYB2_PORTR|nr:hypothetical protein [Portunus trituberculatus]